MKYYMNPTQSVMIKYLLNITFTQQQGDHLTALMALILLP